MRLDTQEPRCTCCGMPISLCDCIDEDFDEDDVDEEDWGAGEVEYEDE